MCVCVCVCVRACVCARMCACACVIRNKSIHSPWLNFPGLIRTADVEVWRWGWRRGPGVRAATAPHRGYAIQGGPAGRLCPSGRWWGIIHTDALETLCHHTGIFYLLPLALLLKFQTHTHTRAHTHTHTCAHSHTHTHTHTHKRAHSHTNTCRHTNRRARMR